MATSGMYIDEPPNFATTDILDPIKSLYPQVNEVETPLPRCWSSQDKYNFIGLSQNNLRVHYKGFGKTHKDAASVKATHPIPASCGIYYYEVKIVSKGRDGYMGIGLSTQGVNMNRLPGWDKNSYGYHGDDGHSFCSSGTGQPYGPTFTTGDVIGCGVNMVDNVCFYTKNGDYLGIAFTDIPWVLLVYKFSKESGHSTGCISVVDHAITYYKTFRSMLSNRAYVYPTVGLQTPGEVVDANFGQSSFVFDIKSMMQELQQRVENSIVNFPLEEACPQWQSIVYKMISSYLVHHGYCATAEAFARSTSQDLEEEITSIKNRQKIQKMVLAGKMGEAIKTVMELYPALLEENTNLFFLLRVRQFIEIVNGTETPHVYPLFAGGSKQSEDTFSMFKNPLTSKPVDKQSVQHTSVIQSTKTVLRNMNNNASTEELNVRNAQESTDKFISTNGIHAIVPPSTSNVNSDAPSESTDSNSVSTSSTSSSTPQNDSDVDMECAEPNDDGEPLHIGDCEQSNGYTNGFKDPCDIEDLQAEFSNEMDVENGPKRKMCGGDPASIEKLFFLGRELQQMSQNLKKENGKNKQNKLMLQNAFSLLAYNDPWSSPVGWQLNTSEREAVCQTLNSAILESRQLPRRPPLEVSIAHTKQLIKLMARSGFGVCAFAHLNCITDSVLPTQDAPLDLAMPPRHQKQQ